MSLSENVGPATRPVSPRSAQVLRAMHEITSKPDLEFSEQVREILEVGCRQLGMAYGLVGAIEGEQLRVQHVVAPEDRLEQGTVLELCTTFCQEVLRTGRPLGIQDTSTAAWSDHVATRTHGIQTYLGSQIRLLEGEWGTLCFFDYAPRAQAISEADFELLELMATRIRVGLEHHSVLQRFRAVLEATARETGEEFFTSMVGHLARALEADMAFVAECSDPQERRARTIAVWKDGELAENFEFDTENTPCEHLFDGGVRHYSTDIQQVFPLDPGLAEKGIDSFIGAPIIGVGGSRLGHLVAVRRRRMDLEAHDRWLMEIFAARAGAELERQRSEAEHNRLELELMNAEKLKSLGVLAGGIAHDFNNLLMGILGNLDLALGRLPQDSPAHQKLMRARAASMRAEELTKQMLAYAGQGPLSTELMCLNETVQEFSELLGSATSKSTHIECDLAGGPLAMEGDASQIQQVVMNLVMNASDSLSEGEGSIVIRTGAEYLSEERLEALTVRETAQPGQYVFIEVLDTGSGMDEKTLRLIFDPFYSTKFAGRGMGLSAVQGIVRRHRGGIEVESTPGRGSRVRVLLPASPEIAAGPDGARGFGFAPGSLQKTVLVVDDEPSVREVIAEMLGTRGMKVVTAATGEEALEALQTFPGRVDLAMIDLTMPHMNGGQLAAHVHALDATIPILLMSGLDEHAAETGRYAESGVFAFVHKPFDFSMLLEKLQEAMAAPSR